LTTGALNASTQGRGSHSRSRSSVADVELSLPGLALGVDALRSEAVASCQGGEPQVDGSSDIAGLTLNGQPIVFVGLPNVVIPLPLGFTVTLNEQTSSTSGNHGEITVNAVRVTGRESKWCSRLRTRTSTAWPRESCPGPRGPGHLLPSLEVRLPLLEERVQSFARVVRRERERQ
jgi:hypothetical protein